MTLKPLALAAARLRTLARKPNPAHDDRQPCLTPDPFTAPPFDPDALHRNDDPDNGPDIHTGLPWNHCGRLDGQPGMVWYATVRKVRGDQLKAGDWLGSLDHRGARMICQIRDGASEPGSSRTVVFSAGDTETVRCDIEYDVVDPDSQVTPDGTPVATGWQ
jgi:hypothetical protein